MNVPQSPDFTEEQLRIIGEHDYEVMKAYKNGGANLKNSDKDPIHQKLRIWCTTGNQVKQISILMESKRRTQGRLPTQVQDSVVLGGGVVTIRPRSYLQQNLMKASNTMTTTSVPISTMQANKEATSTVLISTKQSDKEKEKPIVESEKPKVEPQSVAADLEMVVVSRDGEEEKWSTDIVPLPVTLKDRPGMAHILWFLSSVLVVKEGVIQCTMSTKMISQFGITIWNLDNIKAVIIRLNAIVAAKKIKLEKGKSGLQWTNDLYYILTLASLPDYIAIHSEVLSSLFKIGTLTYNEAAAPMRQNSPVYDKLFKSKLEKKQVIKCFQTLPASMVTKLRENNCDIDQFSFCGFWTGDLPCDMRPISGTFEATRLTAAVQQSLQDLGGSKGIRDLFTGRYSSGLPSKNIAAMEEMLTILLALNRPYNVIGLDPSKAVIYNKARAEYADKSPAHKFIISGAATKLSSKDRENILERAHNDMPTINFYTQLPGCNFQMKPKSHMEQVEKSFAIEIKATTDALLSGEEDIIVGPFLYPIGTDFKEEFKSFRTYALGMAHDARGITTRMKSLHQAVRTLDTQGEKAGIDFRSLQHCSGVTWNEMVWNDILRMYSAYTHPPHFSNWQVSNLIPRLQGIISRQSHWENDWELTFDEKTLTSAAYEGDGVEENNAPPLSLDSVDDTEEAPISATDLDFSAN